MGIDAKGICHIIKAAGAAGVSRIKLSRDFEIEFLQDDKHSASHKQNKLWASQSENKIKDVPTFPQGELFKISEDVERDKEMDDFQVLMDDPLGFENQVIAEHLEGGQVDRTKDFGPESDLQ